MNYSECRDAIRSALADLRLPRVGSFLAEKKLEAILDGWPQDYAEMARLQRFENDARNLLGHPYSIQEATWKNADGSPGMLRIIDNKQALELLKQEEKHGESS